MTSSDVDDTPAIRDAPAKFLRRCARCWFRRASLPNTDAALVLVVFTVAVAAFGSRVAGYLAALGAASWFGFFPTVPYERLAITGRADIETTVRLLVWVPR